MIKQIAHICIMTDNLDATLKFYTEVLKMNKSFDFIKNGKIFGYYLAIGSNNFIEVFEGKVKDEGNISHIALEVEDIEAAIDHIRSQGYEMKDSFLAADNTKQVWITDPNGVRIELHEYTAESTQLTGKPCYIG